MAHVSRWLAVEGLGPDDLSSAQVERFFAARRAAGYANYVTPRRCVPLLEYLRGWGSCRPPVSRRCQRWRSCSSAIAPGCARERGLAAVTARNYADMVRPFLPRA